MTAEWNAESSVGGQISVAITAAITEVLADHGMMIESFAGMVNYIEPDGGHGFSLFDMAEQLHVETIGIVNWMKAYHDEVQRLNIHEHLLADHDDDDEVD